MLQRPTANDHAIHSAMRLIQESVVWSARRQKCMPMRRLVIQMLLKILTQFRDSGGASPRSIHLAALSLLLLKRLAPGRTPQA